MAKTDQTLRALHDEGLLLLANVTDAGSARLVEARGAKAVATSSAALAWSWGYRDGNQLPLKLLSASVEAMARVLTVPLSVDIEGGFSDDPDKVATVVEAVLTAGAVGINLEDGHASPEILCRKIEAARRVAEAKGVDLFINARTDVYLKGLVAPEQQLAETLTRAGFYSSAGADGLFAAGMVDADDIGELCRSTPLSVNLLYRPDLPEIEALCELGVRRLSAGSAIAEFLYGANAALAADFMITGRLSTQHLDALTYKGLNELMPPV
ncbi:isocitrate lyase/PEP mutase family protein [Kushneria marisflavi]|uniref:PEP phosphonomutase n=1 Tax=Kushneria marisflavi TaxID=157779 RepID=A0A240UQU2_9GAMM|nr:isocitrate lyase/phosphoenolpyruvate mutase family protein [Kushneria marisflavi]ART63399.1 PEP phosphonomutase [Kushneria marisflavi]RKD84453.1 2-methylisocitrate lyase-like PEP mutase family enzyme [Kushneria marisflavi]